MYIKNQIKPSNNHREKNMIKFQICQIHNQSMDKVCALVPCCRVMCSNCVLSHRTETSHRTSIVLNQDSLNFFTTFTGFVQYKLRQWADNIRKNGYQEVFESNRSIGILGRQEQAKRDMRQACIQVFQTYSQLMLGNRQFVVDNQSNEQLFHPQFIKDLCALMMDRWQVTSGVIIGNLKTRLKELFPTKYYYQFATFKIRQNLLNSVQSERMNLISKIKNEVFYCIEKIKSLKNKEQINLQNYFKCYDGKDVAKTERQAYSTEFQKLPWSIKRIESVQQIGDRCPSSKNVCFLIKKDSNYLPSLHQLRQSLEGKVEGQGIISEEIDDSIRERLNSIQMQNKELKQENNKLKEQNQKLKRINIQLTSVYRMPLINKNNIENTIPSLGKLFQYQKSQNAIQCPPLKNCKCQFAKQLHLSPDQFCSRFGIPQ